MGLLKRGSTLSQDGPNCGKLDIAAFFEMVKRPCITKFFNKESFKTHSRALNRMVIQTNYHTKEGHHFQEVTT